MQKSNTTETTPAEKFWNLVDQVAAQFPGTATRKDMAKLTPRGRLLRKVIEESARKIYAETGDKTFLEIARAMRSGFRHAAGMPEAKPATAFDTK